VIGNPALSSRDTVDGCDLEEDLDQPAVDLFHQAGPVRATAGTRRSPARIASRFIVLGPLWKQHSDVRNQRSVAFTSLTSI